MRCKNEQNAVELQFLSTGFTVRPSDIDIRSKSLSYAHGEFELPDYAGRLIEVYANDGEPVQVLFGGEPAFRMYYESDALEFEKSLDGPIISILSLYAPREVLSRGVIEKYWKKAAIEDIIRYIYENRYDPYSVLTDFKILDTFDPQINVDSVINSDVGLEDIAELQNLEDHLVRTQIDSKLTIKDFTIDNESPLSALRRLSQHAEFDWTVTQNGVLEIGGLSEPDVVGVIDGSDTIPLTSYNVTVASEKTNAVRFAGPMGEITDNPFDSGILSNSKLQAITEARAENISGTPVYRQPKGINSLTGMEEAAKRALVEELMSDVQGSISVDGFASDSKQTIASIDAGDYIAVDTEIEKRCRTNVVTGLFMIRELQHRITQHSGWQIELQVAQIPTEISTRSFYFDPATNQRFEDLDSWLEYLEGIDEGLVATSDGQTGI